MADEKDQVSEAEVLPESGSVSSDSAVMPRDPAYVRTPWAARIVFIVIFAVCVFGAIALQRSRSEEINKNPLYIDNMFMPQAKYAKPLSLGYNHLMADFLYLRGIQAFGAQFRVASEKSTSTVAFFDTLTELDPYFQSAYEFGSLVLSQGGNDKGAIQLNAKGHYKQPEKYRLAYLNTYAANWNLDNPQYAKVWLQKALAAEDCPNWLERWEPWLDTKTGRYDIAVEGRIRNYLNTYDDPSREAEVYITRQNLKRTVNSWNLSILHDAVKQYHADTGKYPKTFKEMFDSGDYLKNYRGADYYRLMNALNNLPDEQFNKDAMALKIQAFAVLDNLSGVPVSPFDDPIEGKRDYYVIRRDLPEQYLGQALEEELYVQRLEEMKPVISSQLKAIREKLLGPYYKKNNLYPPSLEAAKEDLDRPFSWDIKMDAVGNPWDYDPNTGQVHSRTFPEM